MTSSRFSANVLVSHHVVQDTVTGLCILQALSAHTQHQLQVLLLQLQCLLLLLVNVQPRHRTPMPHDLRLQHMIADATHRRIDYVRCRVVAIEHAEGAVQDVLDRFIIVGGGVELGAIVSSGEGESAYDVRISGHVYLDVLCWCWDTVFVGDGERDKVLAYVVDESLRGLDRYCCVSCRCTRISWGGRWPYRFGSRNSSRLPSSSSSTYTHPLGRPFVRWGEWGCWYFDGIFVVFIDKSGNLSCQHGDVRVRETNSGHFGMWCVRRSDKYGCDRCWYRDRIGGVVSVAVLHGTIASIAVSNIWLIVWVTGIIPAARRARLRSSIRNRAARSCSCLHVIAVLIPSEGSEGSRISKDTHGFGKFD